MIQAQGPSAFHACAWKSRRLVGNSSARNPVGILPLARPSPALASTRRSNFFRAPLRSAEEGFPMMKSGLLILTSLLATGVAAQPSRPDASPRTEQVTLADLNLAQASAQATVQGRIRAAADRVCDVGGMQALDDFTASSNCYRRAVADGYRQLDRMIAATRTGAVIAASAIVVGAR
jgi:UrcA family protein